MDLNAFGGSRHTANVVENDGDDNLQWQGVGAQNRFWGEGQVNTEDVIVIRVILGKEYLTVFNIFDWKSKTFCLPPLSSTLSAW